MDIPQLFDNYTIDINSPEKQALIDSAISYKELFLGMSSTVSKVSLIDFVKIRLLNYILKKNELSREEIYSLFNIINNNDDFYYALLSIIDRKYPIEIVPIKNQKNGNGLTIEYMPYLEWWDYIHSVEYNEARKLGLTSTPIDLWKIIWYEKYIDDYDFVITKSFWWTEAEYESIEEVKKGLSALKKDDEWMKSLLESFERFKKELDILQK